MREVLYRACNRLLYRLHENLQRCSTKSSSDKLYKEEEDLKGFFKLFFKFILLTKADIG